MTAHYKARYEQSIQDAGVAHQMPVFEQMMSIVSEAIEENEMSFTGVEQFIGWWDTVMAYEQMDTDTCIYQHEDSLKIIFEALSELAH